MPRGRKKEPTKEDIERKKLMDYIKQLSGNDIDWGYTMARLKQFTKQDMTYAGMRYALWYQVSIEQKPYDGVELIPYIYDKAKRYYNDMQRIKYQINQSKFDNQCVTIEKKEYEDIEDIFA